MKTYILIFLLFTGYTGTSQVTGLWGISEVTVGNERMTPLGKWTRINEDGTFESGNGWMQNSTGNWEYEEKEGLFVPRTKNWIVDEGGPFRVFLKDDIMEWRRMEEGMEVVVTLKRIEKLPMHPSDQILGLWDLTSANKGEQDVMTDLDPMNKRYSLFRWDRIFVLGHTPEGRVTGFWHMNGHRPEVTLIYHDQERDHESFQIFFTDQTMKWAGTEYELTFTRIDQIPD